MKQESRSEWRRRDAFVVQFRRDANPAAGLYTGRVEHIDTFCSRQFSSLEELLAFLSGTLEQSPAEQEADNV